MGGLLFLACPAVCPGVKMCTHRGCPWARGGRCWLATGRGQWVRVSPRGGSHSSLGLPPSLLLPLPPHSSTHSLICHCQVCLHMAGRVKLALWKCERMFARLTEPFEVRLKEHSSPTRAYAYRIIWFVEQSFMTGFDTSAHFPPTAATFVSNSTPGCCIASL